MTCQRLTEFFRTRTSLNPLTVKRTLDLKNPPPLADAQKARLTTVAAMPDEQIDYTDAPHLPDAVWAKAGELLGAKQQ